MTDQNKYHPVKKAASVLRAINHKLRQRIIMIVQAKEMNVTQLYVELRLEQSVTSQHLSILRKAGIVKTRKDGKQVFYSLDGKRLDDVLLKASEF